MMTPLSSADLRVLVLSALGVTVACGPPKVDENPSDTGLYNGGDGTDGTTGTDGTDGTGGTDGTDDHWEACDPDMPDLTREMILSGWVESARLCADPEELGGECPPASEVNATAIMYDQFGLTDEGIGWDAWATCGPDTHTPDACCYDVEVSMWAEGRPFRVAQAPRTAPTQDHPAWCSAAPDESCELSQAPRAIALAWQRRGLAEHASVAAFARFSLQLLQLGAPPELLTEAAVAMADETRHAQQCFGIARAMGVAAGPGPLDTAGALDQGLDPKAILTDLLIEGCLGETLAAAEAAEEARLCDHSQLRDVLTQISQDEGRHAALSWRAARWLLSAHPELRDHARAVLSTPFPPAADRAPGVTAVRSHRFGILSPAARDRLAQDVTRRVLAPATAALVGGQTARPHHA